MKNDTDVEEKDGVFWIYMAQKNVGVALANFRVP